MLHCLLRLVQHC
jgi:hypothetical protein